VSPYRIGVGSPHDSIIRVIPAFPMRQHVILVEPGIAEWALAVDPGLVAEVWRRRSVGIQPDAPCAARHQARIVNSGDA